jgi:hypothetical protein
VRIRAVYFAVGPCTAFAALLLGIFTPVAVADDAPRETIRLETPESEISRIQSSLEQAIQAMKSLPRIAERPVIGPRKVAADRAWLAAQAFAEANDHLSTVRELNRYLNLVQTGEPQRYLVAQRQLAHSYDKTGASEKAMRAALRYTASFISQEASSASHKDLIAILSLISRLMRSSPAATRTDLKQLFAAMTSVDMPREAKMQVLVLAARAAGSTGDFELAQKLLRDRLLSSAPSVISGEVHYLSGLLMVSAGRLETAVSSFNGAIAAFGSSDSERRDRARLMLARVQMRLGQAARAADSYSAIDELSGAFKEAMFEGVYALSAAGRISEARDQAAIFRKQFAGADPAARMRLARLDTALAIRSRDWGGAEKAIATQRAAFAELSAFADRELSGAKPVEEATVQRIYMKHEGILEVPSDLDAGWRLFRRLATQDESLADDRGDVRQMFFTLGRARLDQINPSWINTTMALDILVRRQLEAGHRLVGLERHLLSQRLTPAERQELQSLENRRNSLLGRYPETLSRGEGWRRTADLFEDNIRLGKIAERLAQAQSNLATLKFLESRRGAESPRWVEYDPQVSILRDRAYKAVEMIRSLQIENLAESGPHRHLRRLMALYSMSLFDEEAILRRARNQVADTAERLLFYDVERAWSLWQQAARESFQQIFSIEKNMKSELERTVGELWARDEDVIRGRESIQGLRNRIALWLGVRRNVIAETVRDRANQRIAKLDQWSADIDAMRYEQVRDGARAEQQQFDAARHAAREEAMEIPTGSVTPWLE